RGRPLLAGSPSLRLGKSLIIRFFQCRSKFLQIEIRAAVAKCRCPRQFDLLTTMEIEQSSWRGIKKPRQLVKTPSHHFPRLWPEPRAGQAFALLCGPAFVLSVRLCSAPSFRRWPGSTSILVTCTFGVSESEDICRFLFGLWLELETAWLVYRLG